MRDFLRKIFNWIIDWKKDTDLKAIVGITSLVFAIIGVGSPSIDFVYGQSTFRSDEAERIDLKYCIDDQCFTFEGNAEELEMLGKNAKRYSPKILDLHAQKRMAHWTIAIAFLTFVGVVLLAKTLQESKNSAKKMIEEQRDIGRKQTRAYLSCIGGEFCTDGHSLVIRPFFKNTGQSPSLYGSIKQIALICAPEDKFTEQTVLAEWFEKIEIIPEHYMRDIGAGDSENDCVEFKVKSNWEIIDSIVWSPLFSNDFHAGVVGSISWFDVFGEEQTANFDLLFKLDPAEEDSYCGELTRKI